MPRPIARLVVLALSFGSTGWGADDARPSDEAARFFEAKVRPVLVDQCYKCHGPEKQKAGLRLDSRAGAIGGGDSGPAIVAGNPDESPMILALRHEEDGPKMPPSKKLAPEQIEALTTWVKLGAPWPGSDEAAAAAPVPASSLRRPGTPISDADRNHWAFRPLVRPAPPTLSEPGRAANPIDNFVLAKLDAQNLRPNPEATRPELIRRAAYDLTGLPPTPEEVHAFVEDGSPTAYESLIDRLLASPRYGEKWGRHWLDLVRYAETNSYERDGAKPSAWRYRDYVIKALNADIPYDRFVREQLAGDELPDRTNDSVTATAYYRLGIWDDEPSDREQAQFDGFDDIVATTGQVFLGLTIDCARCHDHKLDPIPQKDYYRLVSFFRNINAYRNGGPTDEAPLVEAGKEAEIQDRAHELETQRDEVQNQIAAIEDEFRKLSSEVEARSDIEGLRYRFYRDTFDKLPNFDALKPEDAGDLPRGRFDLAPRTRDDAFGFVFEGTLVVPRSGRYTFDLDSDDGSRLTVAGLTIDHDGIHGEKAPRTVSVDLPEGRTPIRLDYFQKGHGLGLTVGWAGPELPRRMLSAVLDAPKKVELAVAIRKDGRRVLGDERYDHYRNLHRQAAKLKAQKASFATTLCVTEAGNTAPETFLLARGNAHAPADKVEPAFLEVLGGTSATIPTPEPGARTTGRRRALADWIASPANPLTARVMANRAFQHHFGRGIVRSPNNFGLQGDAPTHPELLDWLASELIAQGWRLKPLHRLIMTSNTYKMAARADEAALKADPTNNFLGRFDMRRLSAEEVRDSILSVSGDLNLKMYGPSVYPKIPKEVMAGQSVPGAGWGKATAEDEGRRSIYVHVKRSLLLPILEGFDVAETDRSTPVRFATTQPTQALGMLNGEFLNAQAGTLAKRVAREVGDDPGAQVRRVFRLTTGRDPSEAEVQRGLDLITRLTAGDPGRAFEARRAFCLVALNLNEFLYLD